MLQSIMVKPTTSKKIQRHMDCHISTALHVKDNIICRCNQPCRLTGHYHCPYCEKTIIRREDMESHALGCQNKPPPSLTLEPLLLPSLLCTAASQEISRCPSSATTSAAVPPSPPAKSPEPPHATSAVPLSPSVTSVVAPSPSVTTAVPPPPATTSALPPSPATTLAVPNSEPHPSLLNLLEEPMECNTSVVEQDHCYTLPPSVSLHSPVASPVSSDIPAASQPEASSTDARSPEGSVKDAASYPDTMTLPSYGIRSLRLVRCPHCSLRLYKKNLGAHIKRKHGGLKDITAASHLKNVCVDETRGIFAVQRVAHGFSVPIHVQRKTWGKHHQIKCGLEECHKYQLLAKQSGLIYSLCEHIRSLDYCTKIACEEFLNPEVLEELVSLHIVEESMMATCKLRQKGAEKDHVPFSVLVDLGGSTHQLCLSVHEPKIRSFSSFGRVIVTYNLKKQTWHCPCTNPRKSCPHKSIGKWHVFQTRKDLLPASTQETFQSHSNPATTELERSVRYTYAEKKIPATLPGDATAPRALTDYPACLIPTEETCKLCQGHPRLEDGFLITDKATIVSMNGVNHNISTYNKRCPKCHMDYRYQEWRDGLHNFNDHVILTLELCLYMRYNLQNHVSVSRLISCLESFRGQKFPAINIIFQAYCHFEALNNTEYSYSCVNCGFSPAVVMMDIHRNRVSKLEVSELETPPEDFDGQHNIEDFWDSVHLEMISQGFFPNSSTNPFLVRPSYERWAPWIGKETRKSDSVLNTEFKKMPTSETAGELSSVTADRLCEDLLKQNEATLRSLCKSSSVDSSGSRADLIFRLREKVKNQQTYVKVHQSIWGTSGGWCVVSCPHGIVYSLKFNLQTESPRDFADLLLSWKHFPNVCLYDSAHGLATHTNSRVPDNPPFHPHEGKPAAPTSKNLAKAVHRKLKVPLPWLREKLEHSEENAHPVTGSSHHYALHDRLHQGNTKDPHDVLRRVNLVPELQDCVNSKLVKRLFTYMRKNNYFLNSVAPSTHMFIMRNMIEHRNVCCNSQLLETQLKRIQQLQPSDPTAMSDTGQTATDDSHCQSHGTT
ncbi:uncharacterized protein LOC121884358 isoform X2 [Thunnus maccoyii]|uniref:uncharacterized protein LOC121884358 isoform X2 n=1 Tax=Thunnus maccoyii TaxID=8240 RepID=UPI001C4CF940|nr:uncharacterized protein LOC121884358 isoform X2 [Thunnus maccoyii]